MEKAIYRIIDANFNRSREALRVMEEYCRFALDSKKFSSKVKKARHDLCGEIDNLSSDKMLSARNTICDVGTSIRVTGQLSRKSLHDCFVAAAKRLPEALRVLGETIQSIDPRIAANIEQIRYQAYTLEKEIDLFSSAKSLYEDVKLYVLITSDNLEEVTARANACCRGGADCLQLRVKKPLPAKEFLHLASEFVKICKDNGVLSIINDRADIAVLSGSDGLHLGQDDLSLWQAQKLSLSPMVLGKSTHNIGQLNAAIDENPAYVGLGPAFATSTKPNEPVVGLEYIEKAIQALQGTGIGHAVIGGVNMGNISDVLAAGAKTIAVCSAITEASDVEKATAEFKEQLS